MFSEFEQNYRISFHLKNFLINLEKFNLVGKEKEFFQIELNFKVVEFIVLKLLTKNF